ncbi:MAG: hypothetical protein ACJ762_03550 [Solirubrobacteraceae bacterium]
MRPTRSSTSAVSVTQVASAHSRRMVWQPADVVDLLAAVGEDASEPERAPTRPHDELDPATLRVLEALPLRRRADPDSVGRVAGLDPPTVLRALGTLGALGLAESHEGRWRRRTRGGGAVVR